MSITVLKHTKTKVLTIFGVLKIDKLYAFDKPFETVDSYDFSTLYTTFPHYLIKHKCIYLIE